MCDSAYVAGASFASEAASTQTIVLTNTGTSSVTFNASATPSGLFGGWIAMSPTTGTTPTTSRSFNHFPSFACSHSLRLFVNICRLVQAKHPDQGGQLTTPHEVLCYISVTILSSSMHLSLDVPDVFGH